MTWTYNSASITTDLAKVRRMIGDVVTTDQLLTDEEINFYISEEGNLYLAAASCCEAIASRYAREADRSVGDLRVSASQRAEAYNKQADRLRLKGRGFGKPFAGGISITSKQGYEENSDLLQARFYRGLQENSEPSDPATSTRTGYEA